MIRIQKFERSIKISKYSLILTAIIYFFTIFFILNSFEEGGSARLITSLTITVVSTVLLSYIFCKMYKIIKEIYEQEIQNEKLKEIIPKEYGLLEEDFTEVYLIDEDYGDINEKKAKELEVKYYAKLISKDEIEIILKDKDGDLLEEPKRIGNFIYFREHYKP